jgi:hypothetical protein
LDSSPPLQSSPLQPQLQDQAQDITTSQGVVGSPVDLVVPNDWVTVVSRRKSSKHDKGKAVAASELGPAPVSLGPAPPSSASSLVAIPCAEELRDSPPSSTESLVLAARAGAGHNPSPPNPLAISSDDGNLADKPVSPPLEEVLDKNRVRNRKQKLSGRSSRTSPPIANS